MANTAGHIDTCVGIAPTKTLAKLANHIAKDAERKPGPYPLELVRVCNLAEVDAATMIGLYFNQMKENCKLISEISFLGIICGHNK